VLTGLLAYVFFALANRSLGPAAASPVSVLWSYWAAAAAVLTFPVQHWIIRRFTGDGHEEIVARTVPRLTVLVLTLSLASGAAAYVFREQLFHDVGPTFPAMVTGVSLGSYLMGVVRGVLSGRGRYMATAASLVGENLVRVVCAALAALAGLGPVAFGAAMVVGPLCGLVWTSSLRLRTDRGGASARPDSLALVSGVAGGSLMGQLVLTGAPVVLAALGGAPAAVTSLFLVLSVWRAPYLVAMGVTPQLTTLLTRMRVDGPLTRVARVARVTVLLVLAASAVAALVAVTVLQPLVSLAFGAGVELPRALLVGLGVGTVVALGNLVLLLVLLALGRSRIAAGAWLGALAAAGVWLAVGGLPPSADVVSAFVIAEGTAFILLVAATERSVHAGSSRLKPRRGGRPSFADSGGS
jgi:O-antigen/teichoic acid export membrane protein